MVSTLNETAPVNVWVVVVVILAPIFVVPETDKDVAPAVAPLPIAAFKSKSPVIWIAPKS
ncbi:MAG: hypothetical protein EBW81_10960 [Gammaproteobacteria bacterium]|nr:hypothetical protein [Gammaproteobacteria bacterium]